MEGTQPTCLTPFTWFVVTQDTDLFAFLKIESILPSCGEVTQGYKLLRIIIFFCQQILFGCPLCSRIKWTRSWPTPPPEPPSLVIPNWSPSGTLGMCGNADSVVVPHCVPYKWCILIGIHLSRFILIVLYTFRDPADTTHSFSCWVSCFSFC